LVLDSLQEFVELFVLNGGWVLFIHTLEEVL
jgi:hypothetical protein